jgi:hypothetical protein
MPISETCHILRIHKEYAERWNHVRDELDIQITYQFVLDGFDFGNKQVDGVTRQNFIKEYFHIADELCSEQVSDTELESTRGRMEALGMRMYRSLCPERIRREFFEAGASGSLMLDTSEQELAWELLHDGNGFLANRLGFGRYIAPLRSPPERLGRRGIAICLIGDPLEDLPEAAVEVQELGAMLEKALANLREVHQLDSQLKVLTGDAATKDAILFDLIQQPERDWDILHFACHGDFDGSEPLQSGLRLADGVLRVYEVDELACRPLVFANACRSGGNSDGLTAGHTATKGLAAAFLKAGALAYIGTLWPVSDRSARELATGFYNRAISGSPLGEALAAERARLLASGGDPSLMGYVLFGDPAKRLGIYEPALTDGPFINDRGFRRVFDLESEYSRLELLLANDLPWILWREEDFIEWVGRISVSIERREAMLLTLFEYRRHFRNLIELGEKTFQSVVNLKTLRTYLRRKSVEVREELHRDILRFAEMPNFLLMFFEPDNAEIEEIEIVSKNEDPFVDLSQSVYVFNKQTRFEKSAVTYSLYSDYNNALVREYAARFFEVIAASVEQYVTSGRYSPADAGHKLANSEWKLINRGSAVLFAEEIQRLADTEAVDAF